MSSPEVSIVTAITSNRGMADDGNGRAAWYMPDDLRRFRDTTLDHPVVIAEPTFYTVLDTLGTPLPRRTNIIVDPSTPIPESCFAVPTIEAGLNLAKSLDSDEVFVMGNQVFYENAFPYVTKLYLTILLGNLTTQETFPEYPDFEHVSKEFGTSNGFWYSYQILRRQRRV